jgi:aspartokinase-like uncharacterized kinase
VTRAAPAVHTVIKVGGGLSRDPADFGRVVDALGAAGPGHRMLVVPGGGPFADTVREQQRRISISDDTSHWIAILGMEQYAHTLAERITGAQLVDTRPRIVAALRRRRIPVLAPYRWLRAEDPLPHSWDVTSDSIAAWIAARVGARRLVLIKPVAGEPGSLVDPYFVRALKPGIEHLVLPVDGVRELGLVLGASPRGAQRWPERRR